jgi:hypothetical protein
MHRPVEVEDFLKLVKKYDLIASGGSDYHGDKDEKIGYYMPSKPIPFEIYQNLKR